MADDGMEGITTSSNIATPSNNITNEASNSQINHYSINHPQGIGLTYFS